MNACDFYLRDPSVGDGEPVGFRLAWPGLAGITGLPTRPYVRRRPWVTAPDSTIGSWGSWQWELDVCMVDALATLPGDEAETRTGAEMRAALLAFLPLASFELTDAGGTAYTVSMSGYEERLLEPFDPTHPTGGWLAHVSLVATS